MTRYAAFLRGVNVGGSKVIRMEDLRRAFAALGFADVATLGASGNVVFAADGRPDAVRVRIERGLAARFGAEIAAFARTAAELAALVRADPFKKAALREATPYVVFLGAKPAQALPRRSSDGSVAVLRAVGREVFCAARRVGGKGIYPNAFVESALGVPATTRNWSTVLKAAAAAAPLSKPS